MHSTLEPLSQCIRFAFDTGNNEYALTSSMYYLLRGLSSGKNIKVLIDEVNICVRQLGNNFGNDSSFKTPSYTLFENFFFTPLNNVLYEFEGDDLTSKSQVTSFSLSQAQIVNNHGILQAAIGLERFNFILTLLSVQLPCEFLFRNMNRALEYSNMYFEYFMVSLAYKLYFLNFLYRYLSTLTPIHLRSNRTSPR